MKTYFVKTISNINEMMLHSLMQSEFETTDLTEAKSVFEKEISILNQTYLRADKLTYQPTDKEYKHAVHCEIFSVEKGER